MITDITDVTLASKQSTAEQQCHGRNLCKNGFQSFFYTKIQHHIIRKFAFFSVLNISKYKTRIQETYQSRRQKIQETYQSRRQNILR